MDYLIFYCKKMRKSKKNKQLLLQKHQMRKKLMQNEKIVPQSRETFICYPTSLEEIKYYSDDEINKVVLLMPTGVYSRKMNKEETIHALNQFDILSRDNLFDYQNMDNISFFERHILNKIDLIYINEDEDIFHFLSTLNNFEYRALIHRIIMIPLNNGLSITRFFIDKIENSGQRVLTIKSYVPLNKLLDVGIGIMCLIKTMSTLVRFIKQKNHWSTFFKYRFLTQSLIDDHDDFKISRQELQSRSNVDINFTHSDKNCVQAFDDFQKHIVLETHLFLPEIPIQNFDSYLDKRTRLINILRHLII